MREWDQPFRQDGEGLSARMADPAADPDAMVSVVVRLPESSPVADDRVVTAKGAYSRQQSKRNHPGSGLSCLSGSAIKRITAGVKALPLTLARKRFDLLAGPSPSRYHQIQTKKEYSFLPDAARPSTPTLAGNLALFGN